MRRTKIVCTMGPATDSEEVLKDLMLAGMDVARLNFSHGSHEEAKARMDRIKKVRAELDIPVAILLDTKGPEIRVKSFKDGKAFLKAGNKFTLYTDDVEGDENGVSITYKDLPRDIRPGATLLIDDGLIEIEALSVKSDRIICEVKSGGEISNSKGVNVPNVSLSMPYMSQKDIDDILFGIEQDVDFIAASFVRTADDVIEIRNLLEKHGGSDIRIIAKIENNEGVENIDEILKVSNGVMVARGDMGVEIPLELLPAIQKRIIKKTYRAGKVVITATQMLDSMIRNPRPTRAETTDVANAIYDGTSAIMLSGETAAGKYPVEAVRTMAKIAEKTESCINFKKRFQAHEYTIKSITDAVSQATCASAFDLNAKAIITVSQSGYTARKVSRFRPECVIIAATTSEKVYNQLALNWGVLPTMALVQKTPDALFSHAAKCALNTGAVHEGDLAVLTGSSEVGKAGNSNTMRIEYLHY